MRLIAVDGHDGAGKTTLATALAEQLDAHYVRPFVGERGRRLIEAWNAQRHDEVLTVGHEAIRDALVSARTAERVILDRGWLTVATLVPSSHFAIKWRLWVPTALAWCNERTTRARLRERVTDDAEPEDWHAHFLKTYKDRLELHPGPIIRTDELDMAECLAVLTTAFNEAPAFELAF